MEKKWKPCWCGMLMGILVIVFTWFHLSWSAMALTILGIATFIGSLINKCCCKKGDEQQKSSCCS